MIHLIRQDLSESECPNSSYFPPEEQTESAEPEPEIEIHNKDDIHAQVPMSSLTPPISRAGVVAHFALPEDSIIKLTYEGKLIPWSMVGLCDKVEIRVVRPHQNVKPHISEGQSCSDVLIKKKVKELEGRLASLEGVADPALISAKTERDLQLLTKQISFLGRRLEEADQAEWIKKT